MNAEVSARIGAGYGERSPARVTHRNGYLSRAWDIRIRTMDLRIPKLREVSYFPSLLDHSQQSTLAASPRLQQAYVEGVSTRRVDDLVKALGCEGISKSQVSRICSELDEVVQLRLSSYCRRCPGLGGGGVQFLRRRSRPALGGCRLSSLPSPLGVGFIPTGSRSAYRSRTVDRQRRCLRNLHMPLETATSLTATALDFIIITAPVVRSGARARFRYKSRSSTRTRYFPRTSTRWV